MWAFPRNHNACNTASNTKSGMRRLDRCNSSTLVSGPTAFSTKVWMRHRSWSASLVSLGTCGQSVLSSFRNFVMSVAGIPNVFCQRRRVLLATGLTKASANVASVAADNLCRGKMSAPSSSGTPFNLFSEAGSSSSSSDQTRWPSGGGLSSDLSAQSAGWLRCGVASPRGRSDGMGPWALFVLVHPHGKGHHLLGECFRHTPHQ